MSKFNKSRLADYHDFLLGYPWKEDWLPAEVEGILKVLTELIDEEDTK